MPQISGSESGAVKPQSGSELSETAMGESILSQGREKCGARVPLARRDPTWVHVLWHVSLLFSTSGTLLVFLFAG